MIIPIGHEHTTVRRQPWVTLGIMGLCVLAFLLTSIAVSGRAPLEQRLEDFVEYFLEHPYLQLSQEQERLLKEIFGPVGLSRDFEAFIETRLESLPYLPTDPARLEREKFELDRRFAEVTGSIDSDPHFVWGLVPAAMEPHAFVTYQFMHGGFWHLFGNLFILFLAGPFIEDVWGRPLYAGFYLTAGVFSALMFALRYPDLEGPLIGASGAIAGVMGAFLVRYWSTKIKFLYWFFFVFVGTFTAPAWLMLPLWFVKELLFAQAHDVVAPGSGGGGIAYWAHVWGFGFGAVAALAIRRFRVEERYIHGAIESKITLVDNPAVEQAMELHASGQSDRAQALLECQLAADPGNVDLAAAPWNLCAARGEVRTALAPMLSALQRAARAGDAEAVVAHWPIVLAEGGELEVEPSLGLKLVEILQAAGMGELARRTVDTAIRPLGPDAPPGLVVRLARAAAAVDAATALTHSRRALDHPELPPQARHELEALAGEVRSRAAEGAADGGAALPVDPVRDLSPVDPAGLEPRTLQVAEAVPRALDASSLEFSLGGQDRRLPLDQVQVLAVAGIRGQGGGRPFVLVDLLLDPPWGERTRLRCVRLRSSSFDPRALVGGDEAMAAFRSLLDRLLEASEAVPLPDPEGARGRPFRNFDSIRDYERQALGVGA